MMEDSMGSFVDKGFSPKQQQEEDGQEESGWTAYFEDLSSISRGHGSKYSNIIACASSSSSSSLVSDAASGAAWKPTVANHVLACSSMAASPQIPRKLSFKKTRTREISYHDDSLEDTASSPVNSPKKMEMNFRKTDSRQGKGDHGADHYSKLDMNDFNNGKNNIDQCTDLKKRGLCLVPLSMPFIKNIQKRTAKGRPLHVHDIKAGEHRRPTELLIRTFSRNNPTINSWS